MEHLKSDKGFIYLVTNLINGKKYVGQTRREVLFRFRQHTKYPSAKMPLGRSIIKYGADHFSVASLECCSLASLNARERFWISELRVASPHGYNATSGGASFEMSAETRAKMSAWRKGRRHTATWNEKVAASLRGRRHSPERIEKQRQATIGKSNDYLRSVSKPVVAENAQTGEKLIFSSRWQCSKHFGVPAKRVCLNLARGSKSFLDDWRLFNG